MVDIICAIIAGVSAVIVAIVGAIQIKSGKEVRRQAELREKESLLSLRMMDATLQLSVVVSNALTGGHNNGNVERARQAATKVAEEYETFMKETLARELSK